MFTASTKLTLRAAALCLIGLLTACSSAGGETLDRGPLGDLAAASQGQRGPLTAAPTPAERQGKADGYDPRDEYPNAYGFTAAWNTQVTLPGEFEPARGLLIGWGAGAYAEEQFMLEIIRAASTEVPVTIVVPDQRTANTLDYDMDRFGVDTSRVNYLLFEVDSVWMRDYGPLSVVTPTGGRGHVDLRYYWGRWMDDYFPTAYAGSRGEGVARPPIEMEGGNFLSDGQGRCVTTDANVARNAAFGYTQDDIRALLRDYLGCVRTTVVPAMQNEGTGHVDMSVHITAPGEVIVGKYDPRDDAVNAQRLETAAARLAADGFLVRRVWMPKNDGQTVFRSYTNALAVNGKVLVPVYAEDRRGEASALATFADAYPGREIVPIGADGIIQMAGAIHCVTMTLGR